VFQRLRTLHSYGANLIFALTVFAIVALVPNSVRADTITLTGGRVIVNRTLVGSTVFTVDLVGEGFNLHFFEDRTVSFPTSFDYPTSTFGCGCDGIGTVTFNGVTNNAFAGGGNFTDSTIFGSLTIFGNFDSINQPPYPFTLVYIGTGVLERSGNITTFTVNSPVPEPATLLLLATGLAGTAAAWRRRRARGA
jgi:hypothetical protein